MVISTTESGEIAADEQETIVTPMRFPVTIKELCTEGKIVQEGDLLIRMESKDMDDALLDQDLKVRAAEDDADSAATKLTVTIKTTDQKISKAKQAVEDARSDLRKFEEAELPQERDDAESRIIMANRDLELAKGKLDSKEKINADPALKQPYSDNEIKSDRLNVDQLKLAVSKAETDKKILFEYTHPRKDRDLKTAVSSAELDLEMTTLQGEADIRLAKDADESAKDRLNKQKGRQTGLREEAAGLVLKAKKPGLVVLETRRRPWDTPVNVAVGEKIEPSRQLMIIPNMNTLQVDTRVYESVRDQVRLNLPAVIRLEAKHGASVCGHVSKVSPLPDSQNPWLSPGVKVYPTVVAFDNPSNAVGLKPGMAADVEIVLSHLDDVLNVPIAAVFSDSDKTFSFRVKPDGGVERVPVVVGKTSESRAEILSGLEEGQTVLLAPPPGEQVYGKLGINNRTDAPTTRPAPEATSQPVPAASRPTSGPTSEPLTRAASRPTSGPTSEPLTRAASRPSDDTAGDATQPSPSDSGTARPRELHWRYGRRPAWQAVTRPGAAAGGRCGGQDSNHE